MRFDKAHYLTEMAALVRQAFKSFQSVEPTARAYVVSIWTDPDAAASSVSVETRHHTAEFIGTVDGFNDSPADFQYRDLAECDHASFPPLWEERTSGECWDVLEPALLEVAKDALSVFSACSLEENAILGVNGRRDWFEHRFSLQYAA